MAELTVEGLTVRYGRVEAVRDLSLSAHSGAVTTIVGPNGAGKSTFLNTVVGLVRPAAGEVSIDGRTITGVSPEELFRTGVALVPEGKRVFSTLTVDENLRLAASVFGRGRNDAVEECLQAFPRLKERLDIRAAMLSGGEQQMLMISRALVARPSFLLLDEPSTGLSPLLVQDVLNALRRLAEQGVGVVLVEQFVQQAVSISTDVIVLARAEIRARYSAEGAAAALADKTFFTAYSGREPSTPAAGGESTSAANDRSA